MAHDVIIIWHVRAHHGYEVGSYWRKKVTDRETNIDCGSIKKTASDKFLRMSVTVCH